MHYIRLSQSVHFGTLEIIYAKQNVLSVLPQKIKNADIFLKEIS